MPNYLPPTTLNLVEAMAQGVRVDKHTHPIVTGQNAIFSVTGTVLLVDLIGEVETQLEAAALTLHFDFDADAGGGFDAAMSVASADLTGTAAGNLLIMPATAAGALTLPAHAYLKLFPTIGWVLKDGDIDLHASAGNTGGITWSVWYIPLEDNARIVAV